jgi:hypothetical protein
MIDNFPKYILGFLGIVYLLSCIAEVFMVKNGVEAVFSSVEKVVPHMTMFLLGFYFSKK